MDNTFRTILNPEPSDIQIEHQSGVLCMGSCFAEHIGKRLDDFKFQNFLNPFGIIYNPISLMESLEVLLDENKSYEEKDLFENLGGWHSFQHHGSFSGTPKEEVLQRINNTLTNARAFLKKTEFLILTLGTANVFVEKASDKIVANCHKVPQQNFYRKKLSVDEMVEKMSAVFDQLIAQFPNLKIIATVSPVRHIRDGLIENQISKSKLILTIHQLAEQYDFLKYFPAYELLLDDLRDYRFYKKDLIHPSEMAVDYIWKFFEKTFFSSQTIAINSKVEKIKMAAAHRPFQPHAPAHLDFVKKQIEKIEKLENEFPFLNFELEKNYFKNVNS